MKMFVRPALWAVCGVSLLAFAACSKEGDQAAVAPPAETAAPAGEMTGESSMAMDAPAAEEHAAVDLAAEEQAIRDLNTKWSAAINAKDVTTSVNMYAEDGGLYAPGAPAAIGHEAITAMWTGISELPNLALTLNTTNLTFASSGDMAVETGTYTLNSGDAASMMTENGKYVVTWVKRDGEWKVLTDMFSSDTPMAPAPDAAPAEGAPAEGEAAPAEGAPAPTEEAPAEEPAPGAQ